MGQADKQAVWRLEGRHTPEIESGGARTLPGVGCFFGSRMCADCAIDLRRAIHRNVGHGGVKLSFRQELSNAEKGRVQDLAF